MERGKRYFFKTTTYYYIGTFVSQTVTHAIVDDVIEVYETGPLDDFFSGKVKTSEKIPVNGCLIPMNGTFVSPYPSK